MRLLGPIALLLSAAGRDQHPIGAVPLARRGSVACAAALRDTCGSDAVWASPTECGTCIARNTKALQARGCAAGQLSSFCDGGACKVALQKQCGQLTGLAHARDDANYSAQGCLHCAAVWGDARLAPAGCNGSATLGNESQPSAFLVDQCRLRPCTAALQQLVPPPVCANDGYAGGALECNATQRSACEAATTAHKATLADSGCGATDLAMWCRSEAADMPPKICPPAPGGPLPQPPVPAPAPNSSKRIRWFAGSSESLGCLFDKWSMIADGVIQCCHGPPALDNLGAVSNASLDNTSAWAWMQNAGKTLHLSIGAGNGAIATTPLICSVAVKRKDQIAASLLSIAMANRITGFQLDWELPAKNDVGCFVELWSAVAAVLRPHGIELGTDIDQSCFRGGCPESQYSYEWDFVPMIGTFSWFSTMSTYPAAVDRPAAQFLQAEPCASGHLCGIKGYITDLKNHGVPTEKISAALSISGLPGQGGCGSRAECYHGCNGNACGCTGKFDPKGEVSGAGWTQPSLREFLEFLDAEGVRSIDIWTGGALVSPEAVEICDWFIDELKRWRHPPAAPVVLE